MVWCSNKLKGTASAVLFFILSSFYSQDGEYGFGVSIGGGVTGTTYSHQGFNDFFVSYNDKFRSSLSKELSFFKPNLGYTVRGEISIGGGIRVGLIKHFMKTSSTAEFINGEQRHFEIIFKGADWYMDLMIPKEKKVRWGMAITSVRQKATFYGSYIYKNGYQSFISGNDAYGLSGIYRAMFDDDVALGIRCDLKLHKKVFISLRGEKLGIFKGLGSRLLPHRDEMHNNILSGAIFGNGQLPFYLPSDVNNAGNPFFTNIGNNNIYGGFKGFRLMVSMHIYLYRKMGSLYN